MSVEDDLATIDREVAEEQKKKPEAAPAPSPVDADLAKIDAEESKPVTLADRVAGKSFDELDDITKIDFEEEKNADELEKIRKVAPALSLSNDQHRIRFEAARKKSQKESVGEKTTDVGKAAWEAGKNFAMEGLPSMVAGAGKLAAASGKGIASFDPVMGGDAAEKEKARKGAADAWRSLGIGSIEGLEDFGNSVFYKTTAGGTAMTDAIKEKLGLQNEEGSFDNFMARQRFDEAQAIEKKKHPDRAATLSADAIRLAGNEKLADAVESNAIVPDKDIAAASAVLPVDPLAAATMGAGKVLRLLKPLKTVETVAADVAKGSRVGRALEGVGGLTETVGAKVDKAAKYVGSELPKTIIDKLGPGWSILGGSALGYQLATAFGLPKVAAALLLARSGGKIAETLGGIGRSIGRQMDEGAGRAGFFKSVAANPASSEAAQKLFNVTGGALDSAVKHGAPLANTARNAAVINMAMGIPNTEDWEDVGENIGTGAGMGVLFGAMDHHDALRNQRRTKENIDIAFMRNKTDPDTLRRLDDRVDPVKYANFLQDEFQNIEAQKQDAMTQPQTPERDAAIKDFENNQAFIKEKQKAALETTPEQREEMRRRANLEFTDVGEQLKNMAEKTGQPGNFAVKILDPHEVPGFFNEVYAKQIAENKAVIDALDGKAGLTPAEKETLQAAKNSNDEINNRAEAYKDQRGFVMSPENSPVQTPIMVLNGESLFADRGANLHDVLRHEGNHILMRTEQGQKHIAPVVEQYFDQYLTDATGKREKQSDGLIPDADIDKAALVYAKLHDPIHDGKDFLKGFSSPEELRDYMKEEFLSEIYSKSGGEQGEFRNSMDNFGRTVTDWINIQDKKSSVGIARDALAKIGIKVGDDGTMRSAILGDYPIDHRTLSLMNDFRRKMRDYQHSLTQAEPSIGADGKLKNGVPEYVKVSIGKIFANRGLMAKYGPNLWHYQREAAHQIINEKGEILSDRPLTEKEAMQTSIGDWKKVNGKLVETADETKPAPADIQATYATIPEGTRVVSDTRIAKGSGDTPKLLSKREITSLEKRRGKMIKDALDNAPDDGSPNRFSRVDTSDGGVYYRGTLSPSQVDAVKAIPDIILPPALKQKIVAINEILQRGDGTQIVMEYQPSLRGGEYRALSPTIRREIPIGFMLTKQGNFLVTTVSMSRLEAKLHAWQKEKAARLEPWGGDTNKFWDDFSHYLQNHKTGVPGETGLAVDHAQAVIKKNILNDFLNLSRTETKGLNPDRSTLKIRRGEDSRNRSVAGRRLDRILTMDESADRKFPISYEKAVYNAMPEVKDGFYSNIEKAVEEMPQEKFTPDQLLAHLKKSSGTMEEADWSDLQPFLADKKSLTKQEAIDFIRENTPKFEEVGNSSDPESMRVAREQLDSLKNEESSLRTEAMSVLEKAGVGRTKQLNLVNSLTWFRDHQPEDAAATALRIAPDFDWNKLLDATINREKAEKELKKVKTGNPKYSQWQLPGGDNYKETILKMPTKAMSFDEYATDYRRSVPGIDDATIKERYPDYLKDPGSDLSKDNYRSSHFPDIPNYVAHMRTNERVDADGNPGLFIEEVQADRHQAGKKQGYKEENVLPVRITFGMSRQDEGHRFATGKEAEAYLDEIDPKREFYEYEDDGGRQEGKIPDAPFQKTWPIQMFKRALRDAVDGGKQWIGWTTGETQADRYDLSKQVNSVELLKASDGTYTVLVVPKGETASEVVAQKVPVEKIPDYIGKEIASKIDHEKQTQEFSGLDLKIGGEGMKGFYDVLFLKMVEKYIKKFGGKVEKGIINAGEPNKPSWDEVSSGKKGEGSVPIWRINITPEMENKISSQGQGMFNAAPKVPETPEFKNWFGESAVKDKEGNPIRVYHGTGTGINQFDYKYTNQGNDQVGSGFYFTTSPDEARAYQSALLSGKPDKLGGADNPNTIEAYLSIKNPLDADAKGGLTKSQVRKIIEKAPNLDEKLRDNWDVDFEGRDKVMNQAVDAYVSSKKYEGGTIRALNMLANDFYGDDVQAFNKAAQAATGYDGVYRKFPTGQTHYVAWFPEQIKSATGNSGKFDPTSSNINAMPKAPKLPPERVEYLQDMIDQYRFFAQQAEDKGYNPDLSDIPDDVYNGWANDWRDKNPRDGKESFVPPKADMDAREDSKLPEVRAVNSDTGALLAKAILPKGYTKEDVKKAQDFLRGKLDDKTDYQLMTVDKKKALEAVSDL